MQITHKNCRQTIPQVREPTPGLLPQNNETRAQYSLARKLAKMRIMAGLNQTQMAALLHCSQPRISYLETSENDKIQMKDIRAYSQSTGINVDIKIRRGKIHLIFQDHP